MEKEILEVTVDPPKLILEGQKIREIFEGPDIKLMNKAQEALEYVGVGHKDAFDIHKLYLENFSRLTERDREIFRRFLETYYQTHVIIPKMDKSE